MTSYLYLKTQPQTPRPKPRRRQSFAFLFFILGFCLFIFATLPIFKYQIEYASQFNKIINPLSTNFYNRSSNILGSLSADYTQLSNWFVPSSSDSDSQNIVSSASQISYLISVPQLKIKDALVNVGSIDLKKSLIQYPHTALPGQLGNTVIFGHSVLPQFFNPKSYLTIFSTLFKLKQGDEILVNFDNIYYRYLVEEIFEVDPTDLSVLEQRFDGRYLTIITCAPPGTYLRRLVVRARIVDF